MPEPEAVLAREDAPVGPDQLLADERLEMPRDVARLLGRGQVGDRGPEEHLAEDGRLLQDGELVGLEPVEPRREHRLDGSRHAERVDGGERLQASLPLDEQPVLDQHAQHLLEEERVAARRAADRLRGLRVERPGELLEQLPRLVLRQRRELDRRPQPGGADFGEVRPGEAADQHRRVVAPAREVLDEVEERRRRPLHVVEHDHDGLRAGERLEQAPDRPEELVAPGARLCASDCLQDPAVDRLGIRLAGEHLAEVHPADDLDQRPERDSGPVRETLAFEREHLLARRGDQLGGEAGLADAGLADDRHDAAVAFRDDRLQLLPQPGELLEAAHQRRVHPAGEPGRRGIDVEQAPRDDRLRLPLQRERRHRLGRDGAADKAHRRLGDEDLARRAPPPRAVARRRRRRPSRTPGPAPGRRRSPRRC